MNLRDLQRSFQRGVLGGGDAVPQANGMQVYGNNYRGQLLGALRDTYPHTATWLGDDVFACEALAYVMRRPSHAWSLNTYGDQFPAYLAERLPEQPAVAELAWLEHALRDAFHGADAPPLSLHGLAVGNWDEAAFVFVPTVRFCYLRTNAAALWAGLSAGTSPLIAQVLAQPVAVRVWRMDLSPRFTSMPADEAACLDLAMAGASFGELCTYLAGIYPGEDIAPRAGGILREWLDAGMVQRVA